MKKLIRDIWELTKTVAIAAFLAFFVIRGFVFEPFRIPSGSMVPTLLVGDFLFVSKFAYGNRIPYTDYFLWEGEPKRGDIAVFKRDDPTVPGNFFGLGSPMFIKRIIGLPGDEIAYQNKTLYINGQVVEQIPNGTYMYHAAAPNGQTFIRDVDEFEERLGNTHHRMLTDPNIEGFDLAETTIPEDMFVMMGDNRDNSRDARWWNYPNWGFVPRKDIMGRAEFVVLSLDENWMFRTDRFFNTLRAQKDE